MNILAMYREMLRSSKSGPARKVRDELQCLAKNHERRIKGRRHVCLDNDFSEAIGILMANNIAGAVLRVQDARSSVARARDILRRRRSRRQVASEIIRNAQDVNKNLSGLVQAPRKNLPENTGFSSSDSGESSEHRPTDVPLYLTRWASQAQDVFQPRYSGKCCPLCPKYYFPYLDEQRRSCAVGTTINLCCPSACNTSRKLEIGATSSPHFCCIRVKNEKCRFTRV